MHHNALTVHLCYTNPTARELYDAHGGLRYSTEYAAGLDLRACCEAPEIAIPAGKRERVPTGISLQPLRQDVAGFVYSRSGLGAQQGLTVAQGVGVIDADYRGEICVILLNTSLATLVVQRGERIAQLIFQPIFRARLDVVESLTPTTRGTGGFGHTGDI